MRPLTQTNGAARWLFQITFYVFIGGQALVALRASIGEQGDQQRDEGTRFGVVATAVLGIGLGFASARTVATRIPLRWAAFALGLACMWAGIALRQWAVHALGRFYRPVVTVQPDHRVVTSGPYRYVRHPFYAGFLLTLVGIGLALGNGLSVATCVVLPTLGLVHRIHTEERVLADALGEEYLAYSHGRARLLPGVW